MDTTRLVRLKYKATNIGIESHLFSKTASFRSLTVLSSPARPTHPFSADSEVALNTVRRNRNVLLSPVVVITIKASNCETNGVYHLHITKKGPVL